MKVFGKKTLALVLTIAMALSLCSFTAFAEGPDDTNTPTVNSVEVNPSSKGLVVGEEATLSASVSVTNGADTTVKWSSNNTGVVTVDPNSGSIKAKATGTATITAISTVDETKSGTCTVTVTADTSKPVTKIEVGQSDPVIVPYGTTSPISYLDDIILTVTYGEFGSANTKTSNWSIVSGVFNGTNMTDTWQYKPSVGTLAEGAEVKTVTVKVGQAKVTNVSLTPNSVSVPKGATWETVKAKLPKNVSVTFENGSDTWAINGTVLTDWTCTYTEASTGSVEATATLKSGVTGYDMNGKTIKATINIATSYTLNDITAVAVIEDDNDAVGDFKEDIRKLIENATGKTVSTSSIEFSWGSGVYGEISGSSYYIKSSKESDLHEAGRLNDSITYVAKYDGVSYSGSIKLTLYSPNVSKDFKKASGTLSDVATEISDRLKAYYGSSYGLDDIIFDNLDLEGGDLFTDSDCTEEVYEDESYTASQLAKMYYVPNGSGEVSEIEYTAHASSSRYISGTIYLYSDEFLVIQVEMNTGDTLQFSAEEFEEAFLNLKKSYESLKSVTFNSGVPNSKSAGYVYYDGETKIKSGTFFVEPSKTSEKAIDNLTYEAGTEGGVYSIDFTAKGTDEKNKSVTVTGVYQITVRKAADLTIEAGVKESVSFDLDMFEEFYQENISKTYKNYDIVAVSFSGVPNSKEKGYLRNDGKSIKSPNDKKFYIDDDDEGDYAFEDLTFEGGSKASTTRAEFTVYAKKDGKGTAKTVTGTIDFIVGSTHSLSGSIKASETMKFAASLSAFEDLGGNDNVYVTFTGLPTGGKLVYNWGTGSQEDVKVGTEYYLSYKAGKKLLSNVTFVPSYSSSKQTRTISIPVKAYNSKEKAVTGTINITVNYAAYSSRFTDITTSTYADSVDFLYNQGITTGMTATTFGPNSNVTRAQFVTFLYRAAGQPAVTGVTNKFTDVKSTGTYAYAYNAILWAVQNNITTGRSATKFDPAANVTHQELLTFLYRYDVNYLGHPGTQGSLSGFSDASSLQSYAVAPAKWAAYKGIIDGYTLQPAVAGSRATVALWLHRMLTL